MQDRNRPTTDPGAAEQEMFDGGATRYVEPGRLARGVFNPLVALLTRGGISLAGSRVLTVRGRSSGELRSVPVNVLEHAGHRYLVAPRGETQWVRNIRAAGGEAALRCGRRSEKITAVELEDSQKPPVLGAYLDRWGWEVGKFFEGLSSDSSSAELVAAAPTFPVFAID